MCRYVVPAMVVHGLQLIMHIRATPKKHNIAVDSKILRVMDNPSFIEVAANTTVRVYVCVCRLKVSTHNKTTHKMYNSAYNCAVLRVMGDSTTLKVEIRFNFLVNQLCVYVCEDGLQVSMYNNITPEKYNSADNHIVLNVVADYTVLKVETKLHVLVNLLYVYVREDDLQVSMYNETTPERYNSVEHYIVVRVMVISTVLRVMDDSIALIVMVGTTVLRMVAISTVLKMMVISNVVKVEDIFIVLINQLYV